MGIGTSINDLVQILLELTGTSLTIDYRPQAQSFVTHRIGSTEKAQQLLGFKATIPLREGLQSVVNWRIAQRAVNA
jgi:UDP-glucose 4-epimerase